MLSSIIIFLIVLSILILVHEIGHFVAARRAGVWVEEFGIGIPPRIWGKKIGETIYSINLLPFGGFVKMHGEMNEEGITKPKRAFINKSKKVKAKIIVAGVLMNFLLAIAAFSIVYSASGIPKDTENVEVIGIADDSPAQAAGLLAGDIVREIEKEKVTTIEQFINIVKDYEGKPITLGVEREGVGGLTTLSVIPRENPPEGEGSIGVVITTTEIYFPPVWQRPFVGIYYGFQEAIFWGGAVIGGFYEIIKNLFSGQVPQDIAGPVGIFAITNEAAKVGILALINFLGIFSVNLAILNIVPFPALDGGRLLFIGIESVLGKKVLPKVESAIHMVGMVILIALLVAVTVHDVRRLISAGSLSGFIEGILR